MTRKLLFVVLVLLVFFAWWQFFRVHKNSTVRIGILHSLTGTMALSEKSLVDAALLAVEEINHSGGIAGRKIDPVIADGRSTSAIFAREAERLILEERVSTIFGCWTSASRKSVKTIVEKHNHLLIYPLQYEGVEASPNIVYTGAAPNQQIIPAVKWSMDHLGRKFFLVGSDYVFPRTANEIIKDQVAALKGEIVGEEYLLLGSKEVQPIVEKIKQSRPDVIMNTINGDSNLAFFHALRQEKITPDEIPTMSFSIAEEELQSMNIQEVAGDYAAWNYFESLKNQENIDFVSRFKTRYGANRLTDDPIETAYFSVYLWSQAVAEGESDSVKNIRTRIRDQSFKSPGGIVYVDANTLHTWKTVRIGKIRNDGQFDVVWSSEYAVRPIPFPAFRTHAQWDSFLMQLYSGWGHRWDNPGTK
jgi:urea transport system substrate-binding protein